MQADRVAKEILVIEDDASMRELLGLHLSNAGYRVTLAEDAAVAGRRLLASIPDLIIADVRMPYMSGLEFVSILLADSTLPTIPVILISSHESYRDRAEALGVFFLQKPIAKTSLLHTVEQAMSENARKQIVKSASRQQVLDENTGASPEPSRSPTLKETVQQATLRRARDLAGGVSYLGRKLGVGVNALDAMLCGKEETPQWVFLKAAEFVARAEEAKVTPPGFPANWDDPDFAGAANA